MLVTRLLVKPDPLGLRHKVTSKGEPEIACK